MPYNVMVSNRFALDSDSSSSDDEGIQDLDPYAVIQKAQADAVKKAKAHVKQQADLAKQQAKAAAEAKKAEEKPDENKAVKKDGRGARGNRGGRGGRAGEPRGNFQRRSGKRNEEARGEGAVENSKSNDGPAENKDRRANRRPRENDRKSGNPRTGVKSQEKKQGAGKGNWGKQEDQAANEEKPSQEENENNEPKENEPEVEEEPQEPETPEFSLEEYYAKMETGVETKKAVRQANDGQEVKGKTLKKKTIYNPDPTQSTTQKPIARENAKAYVSMENIGFLPNSRNNRDERGGRGNNRGGRGNRGRGGRNNGERGQNRGPAQKFAMNEEAFPSLGK